MLKIVYLVGNGFDLNLDLETSYEEFYRYYQSIPSDSDLVRKLKSDINLGPADWVDLELELGKFTKKLKNREQFVMVYEDIVDSLSEYIKLQDNPEIYSHIKKAEFANRIVCPEDYLNLTRKEEFKKNLADKLNQARRIDFITFNYTRTIENIMGGELPFIFNYQGHKGQVTSISHVHGYWDEDMVLGVNDASQIAHDELKNDIEVWEPFVKDVCNGAIDNGVGKRAKQLIADADVVCIFGSSIGATDFLWWDLIRSRIQSVGDDIALFLFSRVPTLHPIKKWKQPGQVRNELRSFASKIKLELDVEDMNIFASKIYVALNAPIFDFEKE